MVFIFLNLFDLLEFLVDDFNSPVKLAIFSLNPKQIATKSFFAFLLRTSIPICHTKSRTRSDNAKIVFYALL